MTFCPDCGQEILESEFVAHRESDHPPKTKTLTVSEPAHVGARMGWTEYEDEE